MRAEQCEDNLYPEVEERLLSLAEELPKPQPGDWLAEHCEPGQTFEEYLRANPVRRSARLHTIYLCLLGDFSREQEEIVERTREYLGVFFDVPVQVRCRLPLSRIPPQARRSHPDGEGEQILSTYILRRVLQPDRPDDALAYLALTASDLWPGRGWNFVFGQANLHQRVGVWSLYRNGDSAESEAAYRLCLRRTLSTAIHETGHVLTLGHCTAFLCLMNGSNHREEGDRQPLHPCPVCLRKLVWNLQGEPVAYLRRLEAFCQEHGLEEAVWYAAAAERLKDAGRR